ncbi:hypothetical protein LEN26_000189 [Aphanomyces euteiches]|nr:hypothetical protein AeMF1_016114 [Aphanomyces euteiches]KAH9164129.1 hypothetical protein LEN26_000189 [Aphanomyces euteiches]KAH9191095.1 hypothetical protein AeNC1_006934 [Aphanomyces euteiches]
MNNLELFGFGNPTSALVQAVKELFENSLDAIQASSKGMITVRLKEAPCKRALEIVCSDTGSGIQSNHIAKLCCGVFATTKAPRGYPQCGKFGVGLKAALLYSQRTLDKAKSCLKVTSTLNSTEFYYAELSVDLDSAENDNAVIQKSSHFGITESHESFSGTEIRLQLPWPQDVGTPIQALVYYFETLSYTLDSSISVEFVCELEGFETCKILCNSPLDPLDRFLGEFNTSYENLAHADLDCNGFHVNCIAIAPYLNVTELEGKCTLDIRLLRYSNHIPLCPTKDLHHCAITTALQACNWKSLGYKCIAGKSLYSPLQLVPQPKGSMRDTKSIIFAIDVTTYEGTTKFCSLTKSALESDYHHGISKCLIHVLDQLPAIHPGLFEQTNPCYRLSLEYAPLVANAVTSILLNSNDLDLDMDHFESDGLFWNVHSTDIIHGRLLDKIKGTLNKQC